MTIQVKPFVGRAVAPYLSDLARLRIQVFSEFPYLYQGDKEYEEKYLKKFSESERAIFAVAFDGEKVIGAATALPLEEETLPMPFKNKGDYFYVGELVLLPEYRRQGIGKQFFPLLEAHVRKLGGFKHLVLATIVRPNYTRYDAFWTSQGFIHHPEIKTELSYQEIGEDSESPKPFTFWIKDL